MSNILLLFFFFYAGNQRVVFPPYQPTAVSAAEQVSTSVGQVASGTSVSSSSQSSQRQQPHSTLQSSVQQPQPTVNTSSSSAVFYVPYLSQIQYTAAHQSSLTPVQTIRHPTPSSQFLAEPRPIVLVSWFFDFIMFIICTSCFMTKYSFNIVLTYVQFVFVIGIGVNHGFVFN